MSSNLTSSAMKYLGIDYGSKRVGIALSDDTGTLAFAKAVFENNSELVSRIESICKNEKVESIILGESKDFSGKENSIMSAVHALKKTLEEKLKLPIHLEPEFLTSAEAERLQGKNEMLDASAAAIILKSYLEKTRHQSANEHE